ncbi:MAG: ACP S-malonyltransferase [Candidatus Calescibacterium sp.]|nr:ACP S-malonyltransferase [Candidatus Calescibacterium sp.]MCX7972272.1 ACP S-malonyltransferase [bacterium]MDW8195126.1 ACP S-malonyltransferase [Candidatus Calescibacterium sp.]
MLELASKVEKLKSIIRDQKVGILFPGQASQYKSMGTDWYNSSKKFKEIFDYINSKIISDYREFLDSDLFGILEDEQKINVTLYSQISIFSVSVACYEAMKETLEQVYHVLAGHSLGEYSALVCSECISIDDGIDLVVKRGYYMHNYSKDGTMFAVIYSFDSDSILLIERLVSQYNSVVANYNSYSQLIISCSLEVVEDLKGIVKKEFPGAKIIPLRVSGGFHSYLVNQANEMLKNEIEKVVFKKPRIPIYISSERVDDPVTIKELMKEQMIKPVNWIRTIENISKECSVMIEILPNRVLTNLCRKGFPSNIASISYSLEDI